MSHGMTGEMKWISVLGFQKMFLGAKSMAIVGSAPSVLQWENGSYIDSHDVVVRFNRATVDGIEKHVGTRTDVIVANDSNNLTKARSPEFTSAPKCVVAFVKTNSIGSRAQDERQQFLDWVGNTPLFFCPGPEMLCCEIPSRKRGFSMGTYALNALPYFLNIQRLFVTGFTMFGESTGGAGHHTKVSSRSSVTWHNAELERYVAANALAHHDCELLATDEVAEFMEREGFTAKVKSSERNAAHLQPRRGFLIPWYCLERVGKLLITSGYHVRSFAERRILRKKARRKP